jgi:phosphoribosylformylglycinamidine synthase
MAGGKGSIPLAGTAVYMTASPRLSDSELKDAPASAWEKNTKPRLWKYQSPLEILTKASNGASDFGNKFGQPLICGSLLTFEQQTEQAFYGYDRTIMLAGGIGFANAKDAKKEKPEPGDKLVLLGGDNYRIGMAGGSVSSVNTGAYSSALELSAVQRANPEMQKRAFNVVRALAEQEENPITMIHDHGAGGHMNCFVELVETSGGEIDLDSLPIGDPTLSYKEIACNESQERMGIVTGKKNLPLIESISDRERAPMYSVGTITTDNRFVLKASSEVKPVDLPIEALIGSSPKTVLEDRSISINSEPVSFNINTGDELLASIKALLSLEGVACKDWLTNKVDRSVTGKVAQQQCVGPFHLPLSNCAVMALDYTGTVGVATSVGHNSLVGLIDERAGAILSVAEALTNVVWAPLSRNLSGVSLSANWMWPAKQQGEDARLYRAVEALSSFCISLGIPVPTGKDSLSMTMNYQDGSSVRAPGTVIVSSVAECEDIKKIVTPELKELSNTSLLYVNLSGIRSFALGGSAFSQTLSQLGSEVPTVVDVKKFKDGFNCLQQLLKEEKILAGHDVSYGGLITTLVEMAIVGDVGIRFSWDGPSREALNALFCEKPAVVLQVDDSRISEISLKFSQLGLQAVKLGEVGGSDVEFLNQELGFKTSLAELRKTWFYPSYLFDQQQTEPTKATERFNTFDQHKFNFIFPNNFSGKAKELGIELHGANMPSGAKAAIVRQKGTNGDREMAFCLYAAGFEVKDVTVSDLMSGRETLEDISMLVFPGGFADSDVLGAARGWVGALKYNENARNALKSFVARPDTLSLGVCNGCQLMVGIEDEYEFFGEGIRMNRNASKKFESTFVELDIHQSNSILLKGLEGSRLGAWVAHGEGRFSFEKSRDSYQIPVTYAHSTYPANPNSAQFDSAAVVSKDGRHLVIMPHLERSALSWQWPSYPINKKNHEITPWMMAFVNARNWILNPK